jgi:DNA-binding CsgD family transcriptional regulator
VESGVVAVSRPHQEHPADPVPSAEPPATALDVVTGCPLPALLLAVPSEQIMAASPGAERLLSPDAGPVVGRSLEDFTDDEPTGALELLWAGRLDGYEARRRVLHAGTTVPITVWVRVVHGRVDRRFAVALLLPDPGLGGETVQRPEGLQAESVVGSTDAHVIVDRISADVVTLLGHDPVDVIGQSLFRLVHPDDVAAVLLAVGHSADSGLGASLAVRVQLVGSGVHPCQLVLLPMVPVPSVAFALLDEESSSDTSVTALGMRQALWQFDQSLRSATASRLTARNRTVPGLSRLSGRELEIVTRLMEGDRVPAIAEALFLSPSTVRNHLSAVFRKLRVRSQQELIRLLRGRDEPAIRP